MQLLRQSNGQPMAFGSQTVIGAGGEARIFPVPHDPKLAAKVYHDPTEELRRSWRSCSPILPRTRWPRRAGSPSPGRWTSSSRQTAACGVVGFLMPRVSGMRPIIDFYHPKTRRQQCPLFSYRYLHHTARNVAAAVGALHVRRYVVGDVNHSNILVSETAMATLVDTDSFQVRDLRTGKFYRCPVGTKEFTPREMQGKRFSDIDRGPEQDLFGLGVLSSNC